MWDWLRQRRRANSNRTMTSEPDQSGVNLNVIRRSEGIDSFLRPSHDRPFLFTPRPVIACFPPKCIGRQPCSQILYGERLEDFSSDCWLENHLHRFGLPDSSEMCLDDEDVNAPFNDSNDDSTTGSDTVSSGFSLVEVEFQNDINITQSRRPRLALEELFISMNGESHGESSTDLHVVERPPPYSPYDEPPPTYEEAVGSFERRSLSSTVSSSSSAFMW